MAGGIFLRCKGGIFGGSAWGVIQKLWWGGWGGGKYFLLRFWNQQKKQQKEAFVHVHADLDGGVHAAVGQAAPGQAAPGQAAPGQTALGPSPSCQSWPCSC